VNGKCPLHDDLAEDVKYIRNRVDKLCEDVAGLKVKCGFWGILAGGVAYAVGKLIHP